MNKDIAALAIAGIITLLLIFGAGMAMGAILEVMEVILA